MPGQVVAAENTYVVTGYRGDCHPDHLGPGYTYVHQTAPQGTGNECWRQALLGDYDGDCLILYGDIAPLQPDSIRASSLATACARSRTDDAHRGRRSPLPYGRVIRDRGGSIVAIIEEAALCAPQGDTQA